MQEANEDLQQMRQADAGSVEQDDSTQDTLRTKLIPNRNQNDSAYCASMLAALSNLNANIVSFQRPGVTN